jgi:hypothetical protein
LDSCKTLDQDVEQEAELVQLEQNGQHELHKRQDVVVGRAGAGTHATRSTTKTLVEWSFCDQCGLVFFVDDGVSAANWPQVKSVSIIWRSIWTEWRLPKLWYANVEIKLISIVSQEITDWKTTTTCCQQSLIGLFVA